MYSRPWTPEEEALLRQRFAHTTNPELARQLGRTTRAVEQAATRLGLRKSAEHRAALLAEGRYLGGVRTLEDLRARCVIDRRTGCWHFRKPRTGRPFRQGERLCVHVHGLGKITVTQAAARLADPDFRLPAGHRQVRTCGSHDCANPAHMVLMSFAQSLHTAKNRLGPIWNTLQTVGSTRAVRMRQSTKLTPELAAWCRESPQSSADAAHGLGIAKSRAIAIRAGKSWLPERQPPGHPQARP